ncbi:MAG: hypothetical protein R3343_11640 [Nitriliruptorales bacterium]|nr:hypothetical protein [Nitriliruptorales bacterium]
MPRSRTDLRLRVLAGALTILAAIAVVLQLERTRPLAPSEAMVAGVADAVTPNLLTCRRGRDEPDPPPPAADARTTSAALVECPFRFDGETVTYVGEVVGDVLRRDGGAWVQLNDDAYALEVGPLPASGEFAGYSSGLSVWLPDGLADLAQRPGGPQWRGDVLQVEGVVHRVDDQDGGGLTIRAHAAQVLAPAEPLARPFHTAQAVVAIGLVVLAAGVIVWERRSRRSR